MKEDEGPYYNLEIWEPIKKFEDTGFITHKFPDGAMMTGKVVKEDKLTEGYAIDIRMDHCANDPDPITFKLDKFAALCLSDILMRNIMNQEELIDAEKETRRELNRQSRNDDSRGGQCGGANQESEGLGERTSD